MGVILIEKDTPIYENRTRGLIVDTPVNTNPLDWTISFRRQVVDYANEAAKNNGIARTETEVEPINTTVRDIMNKEFTRADGSKFYGGQTVSDVKTISDALFRETLPE